MVRCTEKYTGLKYATNTELQTEQSVHKNPFSSLNASDVESMSFKQELNLMQVCRVNAGCVNADVNNDHL